MTAAAHSLPARPVRRLAAWIIDLVLLIALKPLLLQLFGQPGNLVLLAMIPVLLVACWHWLGATPGKVLMDCIIIDVDTGRHPGWKQSVLRLIGYLLAALPLGLGLLWIFKGPRYQGWHDRLSGTRVIEDDEGRKTLAMLEEEAR